MAVFFIPSTSGLYYLPTGTQTAALVSSLPADVSPVDGSWTEGTKTLTTATSLANVKAGDVLRVTAGTGAVVGDYVAATNGTATTITLTTSISSARVDLAGPISFSTAATEVRSGYLRNPARNAFVETQTKARSIGIYCVMPVSGFGAAGDSLTFGDADGTAISPPGTPIVLGNVARTYAFGIPIPSDAASGSIAFSPSNVTGTSPLTFTTAGTGTGWAVYYLSN